MNASAEGMKAGKSTGAGLFKLLDAHSVLHRGKKGK